VNGRLCAALLVAVLVAGSFPSVAPVAARERRPAADPGPLPTCRVGDVETPWRSLDDWHRTLLDHTNALPKKYVPPDLVKVGRAGIGGGGKLRMHVIGDLKALAAAARRAGRPLTVHSAFRSFATQRSLFRREVARYGYKRALLHVARPGHSEHQLGTTIDLGAARGRAPWNMDFGRSATGRWLRDNAWKFGFAMSYPPRSSPSRTCYQYEPWHYRYFGRDVGRQIHRSKLSPREWLWAQGYGSPELDTTPPSAPGEFAGQALDRGEILLSWSASTDDRPGPIRYRIFRDNVAIATLKGLTYVDVIAAAGTYRYRLRAIDVAGNRSANTPTVRITVIDAPEPSPTP
jgi:D-alanyl-D-alanine carboxypeptidase